MTHSRRSQCASIHRDEDKASGAQEGGACLLSELTGDEGIPTRGHILISGQGFGKQKKGAKGPRSQQKVPFKLGCLKDTFRHALQATNPCAVVYSYARIRRLVRFGVEFYCGSVADESAIGFSDSNFLSASAFMASLWDSSSAITLWRLYAGDLWVYRGA